MSNLPPDFNPYASPAEADGLVRQPVVSSYELLKDVKRFRAEIHGLAALWIVMGTLPLLLAGLLVFEALQAKDPGRAMLWIGIFTILGFPLLICGVFTCYKQLWAVYAGLGLSYLLTMLALAATNLWVTAAYAGGIFGGHRILSWAREFQRKGIPLTTRPKDIHVPLQRPTFLP